MGCSRTAEPDNDKKKKETHPPPPIQIPTSLPHLLPQTGNASATPPPTGGGAATGRQHTPLPEILFDATTPPANLVRRRPLETPRAAASYRIPPAELTTATTAFFLLLPPWRGTSLTCATVELACPSASSSRMPFFLAGADVGRRITQLDGIPLPCPRAILVGHTDLLMRATLTFLGEGSSMERPLPPLHLRRGVPSLLLSPLSMKLHASTVVMPLRPPACTGCSSCDGQLELGSFSASTAPETSHGAKVDLNERKIF